MSRASPVCCSFRTCSKTRVPRFMFHVPSPGVTKRGIAALSGTPRRDPGRPGHAHSAEPARAQRLWRLVSVVLNLTALALGLVVALLILLAPWVMQVLGAGFVPEQQAQAVLMTRVLLLAVVLQGLAGVCMAVLYARRR